MAPTAYDKDTGKPITSGIQNGRPVTVKLPPPEGAPTLLPKLWELQIVWNVIICCAFILLDVLKQFGTYGTKEYNSGKYPISQATIVVLTEMIKLVVTMAILYCQGGLYTMKLSWKFAIPSLIYGMNNNLYLYALNFAPPPLWNILIQSRVFMTALIYRIVFHRRIPPLRWMALFLLIFGISLAEASGSSQNNTTMASMNYLLFAVLLSVVSASLSTAASVYTEYLFKNDERSFCEQQVQLYTYGVVMTGAWALYITNGHPFAVQGELTNTTVVLLGMTMLVGGLGGLAVAVIIKSIDNIAKIYSATIAILLTAVVCAIFFPLKFHLNWMYVGAVVTIFVSSVMYERGKPVNGQGSGSHNSTDNVALRTITVEPKLAAKFTVDVTEGDLHYSNRTGSLSR
ncbi:uncharacterized protein LOC100368945 [Saccoglossus kowalevskii]|uniref:CMP-sialic acid transporter 1-like n=1 Tax=Saccoglossus kowalevskii TaxID=10224 RepID=A0ABM0MHY2_SACKO|nr:PREDICTED: CMP-sialic acid transporter 1-like [Saccoglossus kowalevskii]